MVTEIHTLSGMVQLYPCYLFSDMVQVHGNRSWISVYGLIYSTVLDTLPKDIAHIILISVH